MTKEKKNIPLKQIEEAILHNPKASNWLIRSYLNNILDTLDRFLITNTTWSNIDEDVIQKIAEMEDIRDSFIDLTDLVFKFDLDVNLEIFKEFFEKLIGYPNKVKKSLNTFNELQFDHFLFITHELFLYMIAVLLKYTLYNHINYFISENYFCEWFYEQIDPISFTWIRHYIRSLDEINNSKLESKRISVTADTIKERAIRHDINFDDLRNADIVLYTFGSLFYNTWRWPILSIFWGHNHRINILLFQKLSSQIFFDKVKNIFRVKNIAEFKELLSEAQERNSKTNYSIDWRNIPDMSDIFDIEKIATI